MLRSIKVFLVAFSIGLLFTGCQRKKEVGYSRHSGGYYHQLLAFNSDEAIYSPGHVAWLSAVFRTQNDSVFWDSDNDLNDRFYIRLDSTNRDHFRSYVSSCADGDSASLLLSPADFFSWQFNSDSIPFFSAGDTVVKINFRIKKVMSPEEFRRAGGDLLREENRRIAAFFSSTKELEEARDPLGFYWLERPQTTGTVSVKEGDFVSLTYEGSYLNGRYLERSGGCFELVYGTPDQLLRGLNYVTGKLKLGQTAKILLPSRLAFGETGSSNGIVPPYTPLVYTVKICEVKSIQ